MTSVTNSSDVYVFVSFCKAGTTNSVRNFYNEEKNNFGNKNKISEKQLFKLKDILKSLKWKKHLQKKIAGIEKSIELCDSDSCYCLVVTKDMVINITQSLECHLTLEQYLDILKAIDLE
jgi:hypothetical protein